MSSLEIIIRHKSVPDSQEYQWNPMDPFRPPSFEMTNPSGSERISVIIRHPAAPWTRYGHTSMTDVWLQCLYHTRIESGIFFQENPVPDGEGLIVTCDHWIVKVIHGILSPGKLKYAVIDVSQKPYEDLDVLRTFIDRLE